MQDTAHQRQVHPAFAPFLAPFAPPGSATRMAQLHRACERIGAAYRAGEAAQRARQEAAKALQVNQRRALETAKHPPLPAHLSAKREARQLRDLLAYVGWWARQNRREQALRMALRAHLAHKHGSEGGATCPA